MYKTKDKTSKPLANKGFNAFIIPHKAVSQQIIPTKSEDFTNLVGITDEELEILANFIPAQEADQ